MLLTSTIVNSVIIIRDVAEVMIPELEVFDFVYQNRWLIIITNVTIGNSFNTISLFYFSYEIEMTYVLRKCLLEINDLLLLLCLQSRITFFYMFYVE